MSIHDEMSRRTAIGAGLSALPAAGAWKSGNTKPLMGAGEHTYEVHHDWGRLPDRIRWGNCHGVVEDSRGRIYVFHTVHRTSISTDAMVVFDETGKFVTSWGSEFAGGAHGLHIEKEGSEEFFYLCDINRRIVVKTTLDGKEVMRLGYPKESPSYPLDAEGKPAAKYVPTNLAVASNGDIYVADGYGSSFVNQYDRNGRLIRTFGGGGTKAPGSLNAPHGIFIDRRSGVEEVVVADRSNNRLQYFTLDGKHSRFVTEGIQLPCHFHFRGGLMLIPDLAARVVLLDRGNKPVAVLGDDSASDYRKTRTQPRESFKPGKFVCPHGACFDHSGNIFVAEWVEAGRLTKLRKV